MIWAKGWQGCWPFIYDSVCLFVSLLEPAAMLAFFIIFAASMMM
jgi:hypothetical protein